MKMAFKSKKAIGYPGILILLLAAFISSAQQDPMFTQYYFNTQTVNPAYAGTWESMGFLVLGRHQWTGFPGAPKTYTLSVQTPTRNEKVGLGFNIVNDKYGYVKTIGLMGDYSYRLQVGQESYLRLGLKAGFTNYSNDLSRYLQDPDSPYDPSGDDMIDVKFMPNFGVGAFLYGENYYVSLSIPKMVQNKFTNNYNNFSTQAEVRHLFLLAGYVFTLSSDLKFKPTFLTKAVMDAPVEFDLTANFLLRDKVWLGAMYRTGDAYGFVAQWVIDKQLRLGYAVDFTTTRLQHHHNGTHEVMISYEIGLRRKWSTPRMF